jgi:hypothetical protein
MRVLLDKLEEKMKGTEVDGVVKTLFSGKVRSFIRYEVLVIRMKWTVIYSSILQFLEK